MQRTTFHRLMSGVAAVLFAAMAWTHFNRPPEPTPVAYSELLQHAREGRLDKATLRGHEVEALGRDGRSLVTRAPDDPYLVSDLLRAGVRVEAVDAGPSPLQRLLGQWLPVLLLAGVVVFAVRRMSQGTGGKGGSFGFGKSRARMTPSGGVPVTFADVAGCDEAKDEVQELVLFLREPTRFSRLGGRIPKGVLLSGPPGTGKTLLARAIAGEAGVPFFSISGSDFVEMFVGVGASRVRDLFAEARRHAPCIVFIDEIDAVGRARGPGAGAGGNDEREQTLNQLLVEMDGFEAQSGIIVIAATNRPDILDSALKRPGRFDRQVSVGLPDVRGRAQILGVHMRGVPVAGDVRAETLARGTPGFSGAELESLVNEAALFAARSGAHHVSMAEFELARDKLLMGPERKSMRMPEQERCTTAYHEAGHAVVAQALPEHCDPVHKVSIVPRGRALGVTVQLPEGDRYAMDRERLEAMMAMLCGGRAAEELFTGRVTTGASNDFERVTAIARDMVLRFGMGETLGPMVATGPDGEPSTKGLAPETRRAVDLEIRDLIAGAHRRALELLREREAIVHAMSEALLEWETIDADQVADLMAGRPMRLPADADPARATRPGRPDGRGPGGAQSAEAETVEGAIEGAAANEPMAGPAVAPVAARGSAGWC